MSVPRAAQRARSSLWLVPSVCVIGGLALSTATIALDRWIGTDVVPRQLTGGPDAALFILSTVATSMVTLTALVLTITMVVVQLAMGQFSPRIVRTILQDTTSQAAIGLFVGTFAHAMLTMREIQFDSPDGGSVPGIAILTAFVLVFASIIMLVYYVHHLGQSLRVAALIELVGDGMRTLVEKMYPPGGPPGPPATGTILAPTSGVVFQVDEEDLVAAAREAGCVLELVPRIGDFVPSGAPLLRAHPADAPVDADRITSQILLGPERTMDQDLAYGMRMLVDIAERGLAEPFLDPTTAVQAIDRLHDCLRQLVARPFPDGRHRDDAGEVRLVVPMLDWEGYVTLAFDEIRRAGATSPQIPRRLVAALDDLIAIAPPERREPLERQRRLVEEAFVDSDVTPDPQGIGSGADATSQMPAGARG